MQRLCARFVSAVLGLLPLLFVAADWSQFRGPAASGVSSEGGLPTQWDATTGVLWKTSLPGYGASSPIVLGNRVYLVCYSGYGLSEEAPGDQQALQRHVMCFDLADGRQVWDTTFESKGEEHRYEGFQALHGYASGTPVTDGESVFAFFGRSGVAALSLDGKKLWETSVGTKTHGWGSGTSPVLHDNLVIVNASVESGALVALDKATGQEVWRAGGVRESWSTPALVDVPGGSVELVISHKNDVRGFDPRTGTELWRCDGIQDYVCPTVVSADGVIYVIGGRRSSAIAIRAGGRGDVTETHRLWEAKKGSIVSSPVYHNGHLYWVHDSRGTAYCVNCETGDVVYEERLNPRPGKIYASPVVADGKIFLVSRDKGTFVLPARPEFELLSHNEPLDDSIFNGSPAVVDGKLVIRSDKNLYCLGN